MKLVPNLCSICQHRRSRLACAAFPDRIPKEIRLMYADHRLPFPGDHDIRFEVIDTAAARQQLAEIKVLRKPRSRPNELDRRIAAILPFLPFQDSDERRRFTFTVLHTEEFSELPCAYQQLILNAEQKNAQESFRGERDDMPSNVPGGIG